MYVLLDIEDVFESILDFFTNIIDFLGWIIDGIVNVFVNFGRMVNTLLTVTYSCWSFFSEIMPYGAYVLIVLTFNVILACIAIRVVVNLL